MIRMARNFWNWLQTQWKLKIVSLRKCVENANIVCFSYLKIDGLFQIQIREGQKLDFTKT